jgi:hypothetical protein
VGCVVFSPPGSNFASLLFELFSFVCFAIAVFYCFIFTFFLLVSNYDLSLGL